MKSQSMILLAMVSLLIPAAGAMAGNSPESIASQVAHLNLKPAEVRALAEDQIVTRNLPTKNSKELNGFGVLVAAASPESFIESYRTLAAFRGMGSLIGCGRFGDTPRLSDLDGLTLDNRELLALLRARVSDSDVKLTQAEIARLQRAAGGIKRLTPEVKAALLAEYKQILLDKVRGYLQSGSPALGVYSDKGDPVDARAAFEQLLSEQAESSPHLAGLYRQLEQYPRGAAGSTESFIYWSVQRFNDLKPVVNLVHVMIVRDGRRAFIASKQLYSSHYTEAGLNVVELIPLAEADGGEQTVIAFALRLQVDMLGGALGFMKKRMAQPKVLGTLKETLRGMRENLEMSSRAAAVKAKAAGGGGKE